LRRRLAAQTRVEVTLTLRRAESVLLTFVIPMLILAFFSKVKVLPVQDDVDRIDFIVPGVLALAIMSTAMVSLAIATGFERQTGVLKRLGATPLSRRELLMAKTLAIGAVEALQLSVLVVEGLLLGWRPESPAPLLALLAFLLGTVAFAGVGMLLAGTLPALTTLAAANGLYVVLLLLGGMIVPLDDLPTPLRVVARGLPSGALSDAAHGSLTTGTVPGGAWVVLVVWAVLAPLASVRWFRWE
jgi:ABC-2 type transport system permease protein